MCMWIKYSEHWCVKDKKKTAYTMLKLPNTTVSFVVNLFGVLTSAMAITLFFSAFRLTRCFEFHFKTNCLPILLSIGSRQSWAFCRLAFLFIIRLWDRVADCSCRLPISASAQYSERRNAFHSRGRKIQNVKLGYSWKLIVIRTIVNRR